jgi:hypothetical protein
MKKLKINKDLDENEIEVYDDLDNLRARILSRLDQYLKSQIMRRGITVLQNTYTGFDTEYEGKDAKKFENRLLSVQTAVQKRTIIKIPMYHPYDVSYIHPLSSEVSEIFKNKVDSGNSYKYTFVEEIDVGSRKDLMDMDELRLVNNSLKSSIERIRKLIFRDLIKINQAVINQLKNVKLIEKVKDFDYFEDFKRDQIIFSFPLTPMVQKIVYPTDNQFSFTDLIKMSKGPRVEENNYSHFLLPSHTSGAAAPSPASTTPPLPLPLTISSSNVSSTSTDVSSTIVSEIDNLRVIGTGAECENFEDISSISLQKSSEISSNSSRSSSSS